MERSYQPRLITLSIVPDYLAGGSEKQDPPYISKNPPARSALRRGRLTTEYPANGSSNLARFAGPAKPDTTQEEIYGQAARLISTS